MTTMQTLKERDANAAVQQEMVNALADAGAKDRLATTVRAVGGLVEFAGVA